LRDEETTQKEDTEIAELDEMIFKFENVTISATKIKNPLSNSVNYDFGSNQSLTYDKIRFINDKIIPHLNESTPQMIRC
jgi:fibronectin type 3 domain-containing protein